MNTSSSAARLEKLATATEYQKQAQAHLVINGMGCTNCATRVHNSLSALTGVIETRINAELPFATVLYNPDLVTIPELLAAIAQAPGPCGHPYQAYHLSL